MRILAVEDQADYLEMLQDVMQSIGHQITVARNGVEALDILRREQIDVILSDVDMPEMDGVAFHRHVRQLEGYQDTPFIFVTGIADVTAVRAECTSDRDLLLQKPVPVDRLLRIFAGKT